MKFGVIAAGLCLLCSANCFAQTAESSANDAAEVVQLASPVVGTVPSRFWARGEALLWWIEKDRASLPLVTTGLVTASSPGAFGQTGTRTVIGNELDYGENGGGRVSLGWWLDDAQTFGVEVAGFALNSTPLNQDASSNRITGAPLLARPFFNTLTQSFDALIVSAPNANDVIYAGSIDIRAESQLWGGEVNIWSPFAAGPGLNIRLVTGFRYLDLSERLRIDQASIPIHKDGITPTFLFFNGQEFQPGNILSVGDAFETRNSFYGGQVGLQGTFDIGRWGIDLGAKLGLGSTNQQLDTAGFTQLAITRGPDAGDVQRLPGGLYVLPGNQGTLTREQLSFIAETTLRLNYILSENLRLQFGYSFLYWDGVARPAGQINPNLDPRQIPASAAYDPALATNQPPAALHNQDFWAQGLTFGFEFRY